MVSIKKPSQLRMVDTPGGPLTYTLAWKAVKNLNLRIKAGGEIVISVPLRYSIRQADDFVQEKSGWILNAIALLEKQTEPLPPVSREECARRMSTRW